MEFVESGNTELLSYILVFGGILFGGFSLIFVFDDNGSKDRMTKIFAAITIVVGVIPLISGLVLMVVAKFEREDREAVLVTSFNETYGVDLKGYEITSNHWLNYPSSKPESDFQRYGTLTESSLVDDKLVENSTTLVWADGEMRLYGLDENEEVGSELPRVDEAQE